MFYQDTEQAVEILEVGRVQVVDVPARQILEAYVEALVSGAVTRAARVTRKGRSTLGQTQERCAFGLRLCARNLA